MYYKTYYIHRIYARRRGLLANMRLFSGYIGGNPE